MDDVTAKNMEFQPRKGPQSALGVILENSSPKKKHKDLIVVKDVSELV